ncbi:MAG: tRNA threonylcarbamoyladenosine dehydratase [Bacteroidales bacterium]|nr:tRNA threonylcarbamoyladenosine dehydratase [Bacteroidales bacterium]
MGWQDRTELLLNKESLEKLASSHVLIAGLGGVGGMCAEMLCRAGIGKFTLFDADVVNETNINRQIIATTENIGKYKCDEWEKRLRSINPDVQIETNKEFLRDDRIPEVLEGKFDYVVDAIDTLSPKVFFIYHAVKNGHKLVSSLGSGSRMAPEKIEISDVADSHHCKLGFYVRKRLHKLGVRTGFDVVFSPEPVMENTFMEIEDGTNQKSIVGTISFMPNVYGAFLASVVVRKLLGIEV